MIKDLGTFGSKVGMLFILVLPLLYVGQFAVVYGIRDESSPLLQFYLSAMGFVPAILISVGFGTVICLLVRIDAALRSR